MPPQAPLEVRRLSAAAVRERLDELAEILAGCVAGGASVSFMAPFPHAQAREVFAGYAEEVERGERLLLGAFSADRLIGTVQIVLALPPNQPHRAEIAKLLVHPSARRQGAARALMLQAEREAHAAGRSLLVLDTVTGGDAERLYRRLGWQQVGVIPDYALFPDGRLCATTVFWKSVGPAAASSRAAPPRPDVTLEPLGEAHLEALGELLTDPAVERFTRLGSPRPGAARELLDRYRQGALEGTRRGFAIICGEAGFGGVALAPRIDAEAATAELGYIVAPHLRGRGVASQALAVICGWAFGELDATRLELLIDVDNAASRRVAERSGFQREGLLRSLHVTPGVRRDVELWSRLASDPEPEAGQLS